MVELLVTTLCEMLTYTLASLVYRTVRCEYRIVERDLHTEHLTCSNPRLKNPKESVNLNSITWNRIV